MLFSMSAAAAGNLISHSFSTTCLALASAAARPSLACIALIIALTLFTFPLETSDHTLR
jgi:hypothetical protein